MSAQNDDGEEEEGSLAAPIGDGARILISAYNFH
jgi:hypothetical protein